MLTNANTFQALELQYLTHCESAVRAIPSFPQLQKLITNSTAGTSAGVVGLLSKCPQLTALSLSGDVSDIAIATTIAATCTDLQQLVLTQVNACSATFLTVFAAACKGIVFLHVQQYCQGLNAQDFGTAVRHTPKIAHTVLL